MDGWKYCMYEWMKKGWIDGCMKVLYVWMNEKWMDRWMDGWKYCTYKWMKNWWIDGWMDGVEHQFIQWVGWCARAKYLGAFISSVEHQERLVGTWEVGTPRRVVASKKICWYSKKGLCGGAKKSGGLCFACNLSNLRGKLVGGWDKCTKRWVQNRKCVSVLQQYSRAICYLNPKP